MPKQRKKQNTWVPQLLDWFAANGRDLPWRHDRTPYKTWVSEIMLQQTKVETVRPYYDTWIADYPTVQTLADAAPDDVLRHWQGLGYYSRARHLHEAVREVENRYGGIVPQDKDALLALPGVGDYTAGAVLSLAYGKAVTAVDGNVLRVFARIYGIQENILAPAVKKQITALVADVLPPDQPGTFNEALMDFGAMLCIPKHPHCDECPISKWCRAKAEEREKEIPVRITKKDIPTEEIAVAVIEKDGKWLVHCRPGTGLLAGMWEFPNVLGSGENGRKGLRKLLKEQGLSVRMTVKPLGTLKHGFSHKKWNMTVYCGTLNKGTLQSKEGWQWLDRKRYTELAWAGPHGKITAWL